MGKLFLILLLIANISSAQTAKDRLLRSVVEKAIVPGYSRLAETTKALSLAADDLHRQPDAGRLDKARGCWLKAAMAAQEMESFRSGPIADGSDGAAFYFVGVRAAGIERAIVTTTTRDELANLGATMKGLFAIEYLLFAKDGPPALTDAGSEGRRRYLSLVCAELAAQAERVAKGWRIPRTASAEGFLKGGQDSVNHLVNQLAMTSETLTATRLVSLEGGRPGPDHGKIPGTLSGQHHFLMLASYRGITRIHDAGLLEYTRRLNPGLAATMRGRLASTTTSLSAIERQLDFTKPAESRLIADAYQNCNELNVLLKVDLPSTLGVTLTSFGSDGD